MIPDAETIGRMLTDDVVVIDIGARWGAGDRWRRFGPRVRVVGFDPDEHECARLNEAEPDVRYVPRALGAEAGSATLHNTVEPACSSLYPPYPGLADARPELAGMRSTGTRTVELTTLDDWLDESEFDEAHVLKLDTQGSELDILRGARRTLAHVRMLEVEVELNPLYEGQPLFGDVDRFLREQGFVLWRLGHLAHYGMAKVSASSAVVPDMQHFDSEPISFDGRGGQVYWGHAYFVPADLVQDLGPVERGLALRDAVAAAAFGFGDLVEARLGAAGLL